MTSAPFEAPSEPSRIRIHFSGLPCSTNRAWRTFGSRWVLSDAYERTKRDVAAAVLVQCRRLPGGLVLPWPFCRVTIHLFPPNWREIDVDNRSKTLFDALTDCDFWPDDKCVTEMTVQKCRPVRGGLTIVDFTRSPDRAEWLGFPPVTLDFLPPRKTPKKQG